MTRSLQLDCGNVVIDGARRRILAPHGQSPLTPRELDVLTYLAEHDRWVAVAELETEVWRMHPGARSQTVPVTLRRLRAKLEPDPSDARTLRYERGNGWRLLRTSLDGPAPLVGSPWFPRDAILAAVHERFANGWSTVGLVGPPGVGTSRIARQLAGTQDSLWIEVGSGTVVEAVADTLRLAVRTVEVVARALTVRGQPLVVLDGTRDPLPDAVTAALGRVVYTSRADCGGAVVPVAPLEPQEAARFLRHCARSPYRSMQAQEAVQRSGGLPLLLEVFANTPTPLTSADDLFRPLWDGLSHDLRQAWCLVSRFEGSFSEEDLETMYGTLPLRELTRRAIVQWAAGRWRVLEPLRVFARKRDVDDASTHHAQRLVARVHQWRRPLHTSPQATADDWHALLPDLDAAIRTGPLPEAGELAGRTAQMLGAQGTLQAAEARLATALDRGSETPILWAEAVRTLDPAGVEDARQRVRAGNDPIAAVRFWMAVGSVLGEVDSSAVDGLIEQLEDDPDGLALALFRWWYRLYTLGEDLEGQGLRALLRQVEPYPALQAGALRLEVERRLTAGRTHGTAAVAKRAFDAAAVAGHRDIQLATAYAHAMVTAIHAPLEALQIAAQIQSMAEEDGSANTLAKARANDGLLAYLADEHDRAKTSLSGDFSGLAPAVRAQISAFQQVLGVPLCGQPDPEVSGRLAGLPMAPPRRALGHALVEAARRAQERSSSTSQSMASSSEPASANSENVPSARSRSSSS